MTEVKRLIIGTITFFGFVFIFPQIALAEASTTYPKADYYENDLAFSRKDIVVYI